jgi:DNA-binding transcriptional MocR family regulator
MTAPYVTDWRVARELTRCLPDHLGTTARLIYNLIAGHADTEGVAYPSWARLAVEAGVHRGTVWRAVEELCAAGVLAVTPGGGRRPNLYRLIDFRLSTPVAPARRVTGRASATDRSRQRDRPVAPARPEEDREEDIEERACACGRACPPAKWRCTDCQDQVELGKAKLAAMLGAERVDQ